MENRFEKFTRDIARIYRSIQRIKSAEMTEFHLRGQHVMCIFYLARTPEGLSATRLAQECGEDKAAISRTLTDLKNSALVEECRGDGKKYRNPFRLTEKGQAVARAIEEKAANAVEAGGSFMTEDERTVFYSVLAGIADSLEKYLKELSGGQDESV